MANARDLSILAQGASTAGILAGTYGGTGASLSPTTTGNTIFTTDGTNWSSTQKIVRGTAVSASGTSVDFTSIPSWVKRVIVMLNGVSTSGTSIPIVQIGSGSVTTTGYLAYAGFAGGANTAGSTSSTIGFPINSGSAANTLYITYSIFSYSGNIYFATMSGGMAGTTNQLHAGGGNVTLSGALDRVRVTTTNGTDTFDAGVINILYE